MNKKENVVIFIGDSQIAYGDWSVLLNRTDVLNFGNAGDVTADVLSRLNELYPYFPSKIFIQVGTNDLSLGIPQPQIIQHYEELIDKLKEHHQAVEIYINSIFPVQDLPGEFYQNSEILSLNRGLKKLCADKWVHYINVSDEFVDDTGNLKSSLTTDGLHLNEAGYRIWTSIINTYL